jgi:DNA-binding LacI/PurR family transcriptional regulator/signal transduction histidine kinase
VDFASRNSNRKRRVGAFLGGIEDTYQRTIWKSMTRRAEEAGIEIVGIFGHGLGSPVLSEATMNAAYRLASRRSLDALVVLSNTVGNYEEPGLVAALVERTGLPTVSVSFDLGQGSRAYAPGGPSLAAMVSHLARTHKRSSFALITGPRRHPDSREREEAFRAALAAEGLIFDERLLCEGSFYKESGREAARSLLSSGLGFDALVCLNDYMALGALDVLRDSGLRVPYDLSVTGFDDIEEALWSSPPLTTVHQPMVELGCAALDLAREMLESDCFSSRELRCEPVFRQSCGCPPPLPLPDDSLHSPACARPEELRLSLTLARLADSGDAQGVLAALDRARATPPVPSEPPIDLRISLREARRLFEERSKSGGVSAPITGFEAAVCFDQAMAYIGQTESRREKGIALESSERAALVGKLGTHLLGTFRLDALVEEWNLCLKRLGLAAGHLILFDGPAVLCGAEIPSHATLVSLEPGPDRVVSRRSFPTDIVFPPGIPARMGGAGWIIEPLVYQDEALGYLLIDSVNDADNVYEMLRVYMSTAVKATLLMEETESHKRDLEAQVRSRTRELRKANQGLKDQIQRSRKLEREVQDISNKTMQSIGQDLHDDLCQHIAGVSMLAAVAEEQLSSSGSVPVESMHKIHALLDSAIERTRQFARTLYPPALESEGLVTAIEDLVEASRRTESSVALSFQAEADLPTLDRDESLCLYRIAQEALNNALRHSGSEAVVLRLFRKTNLVVLEVRDFGRGLGARDGVDSGRGCRKRGMGLQIMSYRAESIGARLEIRNLEPGLCVSCALRPRMEGKGQWEKS